MKVLRRNHLLLIGALAAIGVVYSVLAIKYTFAFRGSPAAIMMMRRIDQIVPFIGRLLIGPLWYAVLLPPITIVLAVLRVDIVHTVAVLAAFAVIMMLTWFQIADLPGLIVIAMIGSQVMGISLSVGLQLPLWWLVRMVVHGEKRILG